MSAIDQQFSFNMTLDGVHALKVKDHSIFGKPFQEFSVRLGLGSKGR